MKKAILAILLVAVLPTLVFAQDISNRHSKHSFFEPRTSINLIGASYNQVTEEWSWYMGIKTVFFHPARHVWMGGIGFGVAFDQAEHGGDWAGLTFVPLQLGAFSMDVSVKRVWEHDIRTDERRRNHLVMLAWNWSL